MTTYYISPSGSDANNGLGPDASHATNKPYLTLGKAMNTGSAVVPGDIVYFAPGYYYSTAVTPISGITSVANPTQFFGDPTNAQGFKDSGGVRLAPGIPWLTTRTSGEGIDSAVASTSNLITCTTNTPHGLQFRYLGLETKETNNILVLSWAGSTDFLVQDCIINMSTSLFRYSTGAPTASRNHTCRRCTFIGSNMMFITSANSATNDADLAILFEENLLIGSRAHSGTIALGSGATIAGGISFVDNTFVCSANCIQTTASAVSTTTPLRFSGNLFITDANAALINAGTSGQIIDDGYNRYIGRIAANTNVTVGTGTVLSVLPNLVLPHLVAWGLEMPRADFLGWTDAAATTQKFSAYARTTADFRGRTVRPWGAGASIGCWQAQDAVQDTSSAITGGGTNSLKLTGAGEVSLYIPVDATGFTVSVRTKSTSYGGASYPQMIVVANPSVGVTTNTTVTAAAATEETITTATITPTSKGVMEVRLISRSSSTTSTTHFDLLTSA